MLRSIHLTFDTRTQELTMVASDGPHVAALETVENPSPDYLRRKAKRFVGRFLLQGVEADVDTLIRMLDENWLSGTQLDVLSIFAEEETCPSPGCTAQEASIYLGAEAQPRVSELVAMGFLVDTGDRRPTGSGSTARVYRVADPRITDWFTNV